MFGKSRTSLMKPKKLHSLDYFKYLYSVLQKYASVNQQNSETIVEAFRLITEIVIWGDQHDPDILYFFLEKNILELIFDFVQQDPTRNVCVQLLQTLNILYENVSTEKAVYYLLSNKRINDLIAHRFDFRDEEIVAYYISLLKTLSFRLNGDTINFFYSHQRREFALYVESIKLFCHPENMVRIAVRTITLNVHRVQSEQAREFLHHQTALPYFSFLVWSVGNTILDIDDIIHSEMSTQDQVRLGDLLAEYMDHLHYINDLLSLGIEALNDVLCDQLLRRFLIPLLVCSITKRFSKTHRKPSYPCRPLVSHPVAAFMLVHAYYTLQHVEVVRILTEAIFLGDPYLVHLVPSRKEDENSVEPDSIQSPIETDSGTVFFDEQDIDSMPKTMSVVRIVKSLLIASKSMQSAREARVGQRLQAYLTLSSGSRRYPAFVQPEESLETGLLLASQLTPDLWTTISSELDSADSTSGNELIRPKLTDDAISVPPDPFDAVSSIPLDKLTLSNLGTANPDDPKASSNLQGLPFLRSLFRTLEVGPESDFETFFTLLLFLVIRTNSVVDQDTLRLTCLSASPSDSAVPYLNLLIEKLSILIRDGCKSGSQIRLVTLYLSVRLLTDLVLDDPINDQLSDAQFALLISAREEAMMVLRSYFENDPLFLDLFEQEIRQFPETPFSLSKLAMDSNILIPPRNSTLPTTTTCHSRTTPVLISSDHWCKIPQSKLDHVRRSIGAFLLMHIWLESLLLRRARSSSTVVIGNEPTRLPPAATTKAVLHNFLSDKLPIDLSAINGLVGLGGIVDPRLAPTSCKPGERLDLSSETLIGCTVKHDGHDEKRFLVPYHQQLVLVEPDSKLMGWGVITFVGPLQDVDATCHLTDNRCLQVTVYAPGYNVETNNRSKFDHKSDPTMGSSKHLLNARFVFEDHIRSLTARNLLIEGREFARQKKLYKIAMLLDFSNQFMKNTFKDGNSMLLSSKRYTKNPPLKPQMHATHIDSTHSRNFLKGKQHSRNQRGPAPDGDPYNSSQTLGSLPSVAPQCSSVPMVNNKPHTVLYTPVAHTRLIDQVNRESVVFLHQQLPYHVKQSPFTLITSSSTNQKEAVAADIPADTVHPSEMLPNSTTKNPNQQKP